MTWGFDNRLWTVRKGTLIMLAIFVACWLLLLLPIWGFPVLPSILQGTLGQRRTVIADYATDPMSIIAFILVLYWYRKDGIRPVIYAISSVVLSLLLFELSWHLFGAFSPSFNNGINFQGGALLLVFAVISLLTLPIWHYRTALLFLVAAYFSTFLVWLVIGYPQFYSRSIIGLVFNLILKVFAYIVILVLVYRGKTDNFPA